MKIVCHLTVVSVELSYFRTGLSAKCCSNNICQAQIYEHQMEWQMDSPSQQEQNEDS